MRKRRAWQEVKGEIKGEGNLKGNGEKEQETGREEIRGNRTKR